MSKRYWMWKPWMLILPLPVLVWISKRRFLSCTWYYDDDVKIEMRRRPQ